MRVLTWKNDTPMLSSGAYNLLKRLVQVVLPAFSAAYFGLAGIWNLPAAEQVVGTVAVVCTFVGVSLGISSHQYDKSGAAFDGTVDVTPNDAGTTVKLNVDPTDLVTKDEIRLKVAPSTK